MVRIKYDIDIMKFMSLFESLTNVKLKDCISDERLLFVVEEGQIGKAIGKKGSNVKRIESLIRKKIKIVEFSSDVLQFIKNFIYPLTVKDIKNEDNIITLYVSDIGTKSLLIGREKKNLNNLIDVVGRYFDVEDIKIV